MDDVRLMIDSLYSKDEKQAYNSLLQLEQISEEANIVYPYFDTFAEMMFDNHYFIRLRGYRLLCKQAKWDNENNIDRIIDDILMQIEDEKPTAVRQKIKALEDIVLYKKGLNNKIRQSILSFDCSKYKESMQSLILKDIERLISIIDKVDNINN